MIKIALFNLATCEIVENAKTASPPKISHANKRIYEIDAEVFFRMVKASIDDFCRRYRPIEGILFSTQMHGCVLEDKNSGRAVYISWQDSRCLCTMPGSHQSYLEHLAERFPQETMQSSGVEIKPALALCNLFALKTELKLCFALGNWELYTLGSWFISRLTGRNICHITNAAPTGMADVVAGHWRRDIIERAGLSGLKFPAIVHDLVACGEYRGQSVSIPVYPDMGDQQVSVLGSGAVAGDLVANIATAGQVILVNSGFAPGAYEIRPYFEGLYNFVISRMPAGRNFDVPVDFIREIGEKFFARTVYREYIWDRLREFLTLQDTQGLTGDVSFYETPEKLAEGEFSHINSYNFTVRNVFSSLLQDLARVYARQLAALTADKSISGKLFFCGGVARNHPAIIKAIAKETPLEAVLSTTTDEVWEGMFRLALVCSRRCQRLDETHGRIE